MDNYRRLVQQDKDKCSAELLELKSFLFNCWLLWGPSITHCSCGMWSAPNDGYGPDGQSKKIPIILQYGYGDENNSIDVLITPKEDQDLAKSISRLLYANNEARMAIPYSLTGVFKWGPDLPAHVLPRAQDFIRGTEDVDKSRVKMGHADSEGMPGERTQSLGRKARCHSEGRIVLDCKDQDHHEISDESKTSNYYTAYIWIMLYYT